MLCMICKQKEAKIHLTDVKQGEVKKWDLCEECAKAKGIDDKSFALADLLMGLGASQELAAPAAGEGPGEGSCPACGFTQADFKKSGRLGCPECYRTFSEGLAGLLKNMHKNTRHVGKAPRAQSQGRENQARLKLLQRKLEEAVAMENYEEAAHLRDQIKGLKEHSDSPLTV
jgi:protein arginine kinase activator